MSANKIVLNYKGVGELLNGDEVQTMLWNASTDVMSNLDMNDYEVRIVNIRTRKVAHINAVTSKAVLENMNENVLLKALGSVEND